MIFAGAAVLGLASSPASAAAAAPPADPGKAVANTLVPVPDQIKAEVPPPRTRAEVEAVLAGADAGAKPRPIHVVLVAGKKDHGPGEHDYPAWQEAWKNLLSRAADTKVTTAMENPSDEDFKSADVLVLFKHFAWPKELNDKVAAFLARGGGIVLLHFAVDGGANGQAVGNIIGPYWGKGAAFRHGWTELSFDANSNEPILRGLAGKKIRFHDETYWRLTGDPAQVTVLATAVEKEKDGEQTIPMMWNRQIGKGRVHVNILGHYNWTFNDPLFRVLVLRAIAWAAHEPVDRFNSIATVDLELKD
jgi:type 1 glutamine amidotransferase